jgi:hypothetical protein
VTAVQPSHRRRKGAAENQRTWVEVTVDGRFPGREPFSATSSSRWHLTVRAFEFRPLGYPECRYSETAHGPYGKKKCVTRTPQGTCARSLACSHRTVAKGSCILIGAHWRAGSSFSEASSALAQICPVHGRSPVRNNVVLEVVADNKTAKREPKETIANNC